MAQNILFDAMDAFLSAAQERGRQVTHIYLGSEQLAEFDRLAHTNEAATTKPRTWRMTSVVPHHFTGWDGVIVSSVEK